MYLITGTIDLDCGMSIDGKIPWDIPGELERFHKETTGHVVIMGKATYNRIPADQRPLSNRLNVIISRDKNYTVHGAIVATVRQCIDLFKKAEYSQIKKFIIGGVHVYRQFLQEKVVSKMIITHVLKTYNCDKFFPSPSDKWNLVSEETISDAPPARRHVYVATNPEEISFIRLVEKASMGTARADRTGVGTTSIFGGDLRFSLKDGKFPLMTHRKMALRLIFEETMWLLRGQTDAKILAKKGVNVWNANTSREFLDARGLDYPEGDAGATYGHALRYYGAEYLGCDKDYTGQGFDQLEYVINLIKTNPSSRRIMFSLWNPNELGKMALPPCAWSAQFYVAGEFLSCKMTQRSSDIALAGGWNIAQYALITYMIAAVCDLKPGELIWSTGDVHVYNNQADAVKQILCRKPRPFPTISFKVPADKKIVNFEWGDITLSDYEPHGRINIPMAV